MLTRSRAYAVASATAAARASAAWAAASLASATCRWIASTALWGPEGAGCAAASFTLLCVVKAYAPSAAPSALAISRSSPAAGKARTTRPALPAARNPAPAAIRIESAVGSAAPFLGAIPLRITLRAAMPGTSARVMTSSTLPLASKAASTPLRWLAASAGRS